MNSPLTALPLGVLLLAVLASGAGAQCELDRLTASDAAQDDHYAVGVSLWGDTALVGARNAGGLVTDSGSAYVYEKQGAVWVETAELTASDGATADVFGFSVSLFGDRALVGAHNDDDAGASSGAAYVFEKQGGAWVETAKLTASDAAAGDELGRSVSLWGDTALIGASGVAAAGPSSGAAYVFEKQGASWVEVAKLTASDAAADDELGGCVSLSGDTALVGAPGDDDAGPGSGSAYVFEDQGGVWVETARLTASDAAPSDSFGASVSLAGGRALVGALFDDDACPLDPDCDSGAAYVFEDQGGVWVETARLTASDAAGDDRFGGAVSLSDERALVGADQFFSLGPGAAYVFEEQGGAWVETARLTGSAAVAGDFFASEVSLHGETALVGAQGDDHMGEHTGSAYLFAVSGPCLTGPTPGVVAAVNTALVSNATSGGLVGLGFGLAMGSTPVGALCPGLTVELGNPTVVGLVTADGNGTASFSGFVTAGLTGTTVYLQAVDVPACAVTNLVSHTFP